MVISIFVWSVLHFVHLASEVWQPISVAIPEEILFGLVDAAKRNQPIPLAAGGIAHDETPWVSARRELWEEAGVLEQIAEQIDPVGRIHMRRPIPGRGFHDELLYIYDFELADNFVPTNYDGEVSGFVEISLCEAAARILADEFTSDAAFVTADFILRRNI